MPTRPLLLEIGTEEIPARFIPSSLEQIRVVAEEIVKDNRLGLSGTKSFATPRRLALVVDGLEERQLDAASEVVGPPKNVAYDGKGNLTKAGIGFARKQGVSPESLRITQTERGEYVAAVKEEKGLPAQEVLPDVLRQIVLGLSFPKSMRWGEGSLRFARPIHWIAALYGTEPVDFEVEGIRSSNRSRGHRFLAPEEFSLSDVGSYETELERRSVVPDKEKRQRMIAEQAADLCRAVGGAPVPDDELLSIVACLVERPQAVLGSFEKRYLDLPDELLTAVLRGHQKYFSVSGREGSLVNHFVVVSNTRDENDDMVRTGAERVIRARFEDARFYYEEDRKMPLAGRLDGLKNVTFQDRLGTLHDKTMRVKALAGELAGILCPEKKDSALRAAELSKTDLISGVVFEFPELQGVMGRYYALGDGEDPEVAWAVHEQYLPAFSGDRVPETDVGTVLGLADRVDNIVSFFSIGVKPTGSEDPFALRRQALGVISIVREKKIEASIGELLAPSLTRADGIPGAENPRDDVLRFFEQRLEPLFAAEGHAYDVVQSVLGHATGSSLEDILKRLGAVSGFKTHAEYDEFLTAAKRVRNIVAPVLAKGEDLPPVDEALFSEAEETALSEALGFVKGRADAARAEADYDAVLGTFTALTGPVNAFFDKVLVMDKDDKVRRNRLALLRDIWQVVAAVADVSKLKEGGAPPA
jgi:glycyl-tRNA synthetase beta chain